MRRQRILILTASALGFIAIFIAVIGAWDLFTEARSQTPAPQEQMSPAELSAPHNLPPGRRRAICGVRPRAGIVMPNSRLLHLRGCAGTSIRLPLGDVRELLFDSFLQTEIPELLKK
jgi:hypothetical protein